MLNRYVKIIDRIKKEILLFIDEFENDYFVMSKDFMRFRLRTDDERVYNQKINIPVCVISIRGVVKKGYIYYSEIKLQKCFYENKGD